MQFGIISYGVKHYKKRLVKKDEHSNKGTILMVWNKKWAPGRRECGFFKRDEN